MPGNAKPLRQTMPPCPQQRGGRAWGILLPASTLGLLVSKPKDALPGSPAPPFCGGMGPGVGAGRASHQHRGNTLAQTRLVKARALKGATRAGLACPPSALLTLNLDLTPSTVSLRTSAWPKLHGKL